MALESVQIALALVSGGAGVVSWFATGLLRAVSARDPVNSSPDSDSESDGTEEVTEVTQLLAVLKDFAPTIQAMAIARRIDTAEEVEIEEFYDIQEELERRGKLGMSISDKEALLGLSGESARSGGQVLRKIYRFKGWRPGGDKLQALANKLLVKQLGVDPDELERELDALQPSEETQEIEDPKTQPEAEAVEPVPEVKKADG